MNHTQGVTLGVIAAYVVVIALLWNLPYVRWVLWPFKVSSLSLSPLSLYIYMYNISTSFLCILAVKEVLIMNTDVGDCIPRVWSRDHGLLYGGAG